MQQGQAASVWREASAGLEGVVRWAAAAGRGPGVAQMHMQMSSSMRAAGHPAAQGEARTGFRGTGWVGWGVACANTCSGARACRAIAAPAAAAAAHA
jgi:hypothetical protein